MWQVFDLSLCRLGRAAISLLVVASGCCHQCGRFHFDQCADIPLGAIPQPNGTYACQWQQAHTAKAEQDHYVIYEHEWYRGGQELGPFGQKHLGQIAADLPATPMNVIIESHFDTARNTVDHELNDARRLALVNALLKQGIEDAEQRVIVGIPRAEGMYGEEGSRIGQRRLQGGGQGIGGGTGGGFGLGGGLGIGISVGGLGGGAIY
jgi:hypothetical protein